MGASYAFTRTPRWLVGHAIAVTFAILFVLLGMWQLRRLDERRQFNEIVTSRLAAEYGPLPGRDAAAAEPDAVEWTPVSITGTYLPEEEVLLTARTWRGLSGHDVLTPLLSDGVTIIVDRGWVPIDAGDPPVAGAEPPSGLVTVEGVLRSTQVRGSFGPTDPASGELDRVARVDVARLDAQIDGDLYPMWIQLVNQAPASGPPPEVQPLPSLDEGPHLSYAVQWFVFASIVIVAYPILLRRTAQRTPSGRGVPRDEGVRVGR